MNILGIGFALAAGVFFGIIGPVTKTAYNLGAGVGLAIFLRYIVALLIVAPLIPYQKNLIKTYRDNFTNFLLITIASIMLTTGLLISVTYINVSLTIIIFCTYPIIVLSISIFITKEKIKNLIKFLFITTFFGLFLALSPSSESLKIQGIVFALIASLGASIMIVTNQTMSKKNISPIQINIFINFFNTIFFFIILSIFFKIDIDVSLNAFLILLIPSCSYAIALFLQLLAIPRIGQTNTALFLYLEPITGIFGAVLILNEQLSTIQLLGTVIVLVSLAASTFVTRKV
ncbi:DMT family transporter [Alphaproteobacteria bacterium]|jgi:drug/metabolite transporter (DMT)-like permease|nr:DMT family transporter [Alphaproteobacteria bacterium]|tara:strand:- start:306 stop:1169 length:864 start_codon:yes stop_codon:yes gene_type:complete